MLTTEVQVLELSIEPASTVCSLLSFNWQSLVLQLCRFHLCSCNAKEPAVPGPPLLDPGTHTYKGRVSKDSMHHSTGALESNKSLKEKKKSKPEKGGTKASPFLQGGVSWVVGSFGVPKGMHLQLRTLRQSDNDAGTRRYRLGTVTLMCLH